jgi:hypothetical protein
MGMNIFIGGGGKQLQMNVITSNKNMMHHGIPRMVIEVASDVHKQIPCLKKKLQRRGLCSERPIKNIKTMLLNTTVLKGQFDDMFIYDVDQIKF